MYPFSVSAKKACPPSNVGCVFCCTEPMSTGGGECDSNLVSLHEAQEMENAEVRWIDFSCHPLFLMQMDFKAEV